MRRSTVPLLLLLLLVASCGGERQHGAPPQRTLAAILARAGPDVVLAQGTSDYAVGPVRVTFLVVDNRAKPVTRPRADVWVGRTLQSRPFLTTVAPIEPIGIPGRSEPASGGVTSIYVARFRIARPGTYTIVAQPQGAQIQGVANIKVQARPQAPAVGSRAIPSRTPTLASAHGDLAALTTATPPDRSLLRYSVADSLQAHAPFVLVFATPKFCTSRTCGPVVDVAEAVQREFARTPVRFIHVEIYKDNDPSLGFNRWVGEWHLPTEPWVFLVGRDGVIKARFEGSVSSAELSAAIHATLL